MAEGQTVAGAYARIDAHEELCAERYTNIREDISELKGAIKGAGKMLAGLAVALIAWGASQIYSGLKAPAAAAPAAVTVLQTPSR